MKVSKKGKKKDCGIKQWEVMRGRKCDRQTAARMQLNECSFFSFFFVFFFLVVLFYSTLSDILALWSLESKGKHGEATPRGQNWGNDKWPTGIFPHGLTIRTEGPQVAGSPLHQPGAICSEAAAESQIPGRWCREVGERESETGSAINGRRITHYCSRKGTEAAFNESNLNLT